MLQTRVVISTKWYFYRKKYVKEIMPDATSIWAIKFQIK